MTRLRVRFARNDQKVTAPFLHKAQTVKDLSLKKEKPAKSPLLYEAQCCILNIGNVGRLAWFRRVGRNVDTEEASHLAAENPRMRRSKKSRLLICASRRFASKHTAGNPLLTRKID